MFPKPCDIITFKLFILTFHNFSKQIFIRSLTSEKMRRFALMSSPSFPVEHVFIRILKFHRWRRHARQSHRVSAALNANLNFNAVLAFEQAAFSNVLWCVLLPLTHFFNFAINIHENGNAHYRKCLPKMQHQNKREALALSALFRNKT